MRIKEQPDKYWLIKTYMGYVSFFNATIKKVYDVETSPKKSDAVRFYEKHRAIHYANLINGVLEERETK